MSTWLSIAVLFVTGATAPAQTYTWSGASPDDSDWFTPENWVGNQPPVSSLSDTVLVLTGTTRTTNVLDLVLSANSLTFDAAAGAFVVNPSATDPNGLTLGAGGITNLSANNQAINVALTVGAAQSWTNSGAGTLTVGGAVNNGGFLLTVAGTGNSSVGGVISGVGGLTKSGSGTLTLGGANTYSGVTTVGGGVLSVASLADGTAASGIGQSSSDASNLVLNGGTLLYTGGAASTDRLFTLGTGATAGTLSNTGAGAVNFTNAGAVAFTGAGTRTLTLSGTNTGANTLAAVVANAGASATSVTKAGAGTWVLGGANTYSGTTTVSGGVLRAGSNGVFSALSAVNLSASGATLDLNGTTQTVAGLTGASGSVVSLGAGGLTVGANNASTTYAGTITGTGSFAKVGTGTLTLTGTNTSYTGPVTISGGGAVSVNPIANLGSTAGSAAVTLDNGRIINTNTGNAGSFISSNRNIVLGPGGGTLEWAAPRPARPT